MSLSCSNVLIPGSRLLRTAGPRRLKTLVSAGRLHARAVGIMSHTWNSGVLCRTVVQADMEKAADSMSRLPSLLPA